MSHRGMRIEGAVALVTGANRGIGAAIVHALLARGVRRVYAASRASRVTGHDERVVPVALDITASAAVLRAAAELADVEILVNNAGVSLGAPLLGAADSHAAEEEMRVNYFGTLAMTRAFAPVLKKNGGGAIVNVLSILGRVNMPAVGSYSASKAAAVSLTEGVRAQLAEQGTLVIGVMPGFVETDMTARIPGPKLAASDVAEAIVAALRDGTEDVYPGPAAEIASQLQRDPTSVARALAHQFPARIAASR